MNKYITVLFANLLFVNLLFADQNSDNTSNFYNVDNEDDEFQFVQNWEDISNSIMKEIENINLMNESNFNRLPEKRFISIISESVQSYPQTLLSLERKKESELNLDLAKSAFFPKIDFGAGSGEQSTEYPTGTIDGSQDRFSLSLSQLVYDFNQTKYSVDAAKKKIAGAELSEKAAKLDNSMMAIQYYLEYFRANALLSFATKQTESAQALVYMLAEKEKLGGTSKHEIARAKIKYAESLNRIPVLEQNLIVAKNRYKIFFSNLELDPKDVFYPAEPKIILSNNADLETIYENYPMVQSMREVIEASKLEMKALNNAKFGGFFLEGSTSKVNGSLSTSAQDSESIMLTFRSNLYSGGSRKAQIATAKSKITQQQLQLEQMKNDYFLALNQAKTNLIKEQKTFLSTKELVEQSLLSYKGTLELFFARKGGLLDVFSLQESIFDAGSLMVNSFVNKTLAKYRYMHITGELFDYIYQEI